MPMKNNPLEITLVSRDLAKICHGLLRKDTSVFPLLVAASNPQGVYAVDELRPNLNVFLFDHLKMTSNAPKVKRTSKKRPSKRNKRRR